MKGLGKKVQLICNISDIPSAVTQSLAQVQVDLESLSMSTIFRYVLTSLLCLALGSVGYAADESPNKLALGIQQIDKIKFTNDRYRSLEYKVVNGMAVHEGDIIVGTPSRMKKQSQVGFAGASVSPRNFSAAIDDRSLWPDAIIPYVIDHSVVHEMNDLKNAIHRWNQKSAINLIPREDDHADFVRFTSELSGCYSWIGRIGGEQEIIIGKCSEYEISHQIGHTVGLYHPHNRIDLHRFVAITTNNTELREDGDETNGHPYDYASNMHHPYVTSHASADSPGSYFETVSPGMFYGSLLSPGDIDGVARLYQTPPATTTISTNPSGLALIVDGVTEVSPITRNWPAGSTHTLEAPLAQIRNNFYEPFRQRFLFAHWIDGGSRRHTVVAGPDTTWYEASFIRQVYRTAPRVYPAGAGEARITTPARYGLYTLRSPIGYEAVEADDSAFRFLGWRFGIPGGGRRYSELALFPRFPAFSWAPTSQTIMIDGPELSTDLVAEFSDQPFFVIDSNVPGLKFGVMDENKGRARAFERTPVAYDATKSPQLRLFVNAVNYDQVRPDTRVRFRDWSDGVEGTLNQTGVIVRDIDVPPNGGELHMNFVYDHSLRVHVLPDSSAGQVELSPHFDDGGYYTAGTAVRLKASPADSFVTWAGDVSSPHVEVQVLMDRPRTVWAVFSSSDDETTGNVSSDSIEVNPRAFTFVSNGDLGEESAPDFEEPLPQVFTVSNYDKEGRELDYSITSEHDWVEIDPPHGNLLMGESEQIAVKVSPEGLDQGIHKANISIEVSKGDIGSESKHVETASVDLLKLQDRSGKWHLEIFHSEGGGIEISPRSIDQFYDEGSTPRFRAIPHDGWRFLAWEKSSYCRNRYYNGVAYPDTAVCAEPPIYDTEIAVTLDRDTRMVATFHSLSHTIAGTGWPSFGGDGGPAVDAQFNHPTGLAIDSNGNIYVADYYNGRIRRIDGSTGIVTTVAGCGAPAECSNPDDTKDGVPAVRAFLAGPHDVAVDSEGNVHIADRFGHRIRKIDVLDGTISTVAGTGESGYEGDGGPASSARLSYPGRLTIAPSGNIYVAEWGNFHNVRKIDGKSGIITTVVGGHSCCFEEGGLASETSIGRPEAVAVDAEETIYVQANGLFRVDPETGILSTVGRFDIDDMVLNSDGTQLFATQASSHINQIDLSTGKLVESIWNFPNAGSGLALGSRSEGIAITSEGRLYVTDVARHQVLFVQ